VLTLPDAPPGYEPLRSDVPWDPGYLALEEPEERVLLADLGDAATGPAALSPVAITSPFRLLTDDGAAVLGELCRELEAYASGDNRIAKRARGGVYRSAFLLGLATDPDLLAFMRRVTEAPVEPHPVAHHAIHVNYAPEELGRNVDQWHMDAVSFDYVLMASDPSSLRGGRFEWYAGPAEEGAALLTAGEPLPPEKVRRVEFPGAGFAVVQQGHRVLHRAARLEEPGERITVVGSFWTPDPVVDDPTEIGSLRGADGNDIAVVEWARYAALVTARRLERFATEEARFARTREELQADLLASVRAIERAVEELGRDEEGALMRFGDET
jgi:hypothetical protein